MGATGGWIRRIGGWALLLVAALAAQLAGAAEGPGSSPNVVIVIIDGARYSETFGDPTHRYIPHIWNDLRPLGAIHTGVYNRFQTITLGAHATMLTGGRAWIPFSKPRGSEFHRPSLPTLFEYYRAATGDPAEKAWLVANHGMPDMESLVYSTHPGYGAAFGGSWHLGPTEDEQVAHDVLAIMKRYTPRFVLVNLHGTDRWGHANDWGMYTDRIANADQMVWGLWRLIEDHPFYAGQTTLIVTTDHGRHTHDFTSHGDCCAGCQHTMFLAVGPSVRPGVAPASPQRHPEDFGATIGWLMGIPMPYAPEGQVMTELLRLGGGTVPAPVPPVNGLAVQVATLDASGAPRSVFAPGERLRLDMDVRNDTASAVSIYQKSVGASRHGRGPCPYGWWYGDQEIDVAPGAVWSEVRDYPLPPNLQPGLYEFRAEVRSVDASGAAVHGEGTFSFTVQAP